MRTNTCAVHRALLQTETSPLSYDRKCGAFTGSILITNISGQAISGPLTVVVTGLMSLVILENASGLHGRDPFLRVPLPCDNLLPGGSVTVPVTFRKRSFLAMGAIRYQVRTHCGDFQPKQVPGNREGCRAVPNVQATMDMQKGIGKREKGKEGNNGATAAPLFPCPRSS